MFASTLVCFCALLRLGAAKVQFLGMAISGGDFGCEIDGSCPIGSTQLPLGSFGMGGGDGEAQMQHFSKDDGMNMFRLPISWQFLVNNNLGGPLNDGNLAKYDKLVQTCIATGAYCMIDIHNFARWNGGIIGQGGPTDAQFVSLWTQLATKYATSERVVFELMNEPHHLDVALWAATCQKVITAIREAGAVKQMILLPGSNFDSAATLATPEGGAEALMALTNPDGTTDNLLLDVHKYLDSDNSGTHAECVTDNTEAFGQVAAFLRKTGRKGIVSETGAAVNVPECMARFCEQNAFINANSDVFVGLVAWAAGSFDTSYLLSMTPSGNGGRLANNALAAQCVVGTWKETSEDVRPGNGGIVSSTTPAIASTKPGTTSATTTESESTPTTSHSGAWTMIVTVGTYRRTRSTSAATAPSVSSSSSSGLPVAPAEATGSGSSGGRNGGNASPSATQSASGNGSTSRRLQRSTKAIVLVGVVLSLVF